MFVVSPHLPTRCVSVVFGAEFKPGDSGVVGFL